MLNINQQKFVEENQRRLSPRRIAKELGCSRQEVEKYIESLGARSRPEGLIHAARRRWLVLAILALTIFTYSRSLGFGFVWDDARQIEQNPFLKTASWKDAIQIFKLPLSAYHPEENKGDMKTFSHYRPLHMISYFLDRRIAVFNPQFYHLTNILLHAAAAVLLFILLGRILGNQPAAFWASALFAVHPVQIAAVAYVSGRAEMLAAIFMLGSFLLFCGALDTGGSKKVIFTLFSCLALLAALFTKEIMMVSPVLFAFYALGSKRKERRPALLLAPYVAVLILYLVARVAVMEELGGGAIGSLAWSSKVFSAFTAVAMYMRLLFLPYHLHMAYQFPRPDFSDSVFIAGVAVTGFLAFAAWKSRRSPGVVLGWVWFVCFLLPVLNLFVLLNGPLAEHWIYNACVGFFIVAVSAWLGFAQKDPWFRKAAEPVLAVLVIGYAVTTFHSSRVWQDEISLYENILKYTRDREDIYINLGNAYRRTGQEDRALRMYQSASEAAKKYGRKP